MNNADSMTSLSADAAAPDGDLLVSVRRQWNDRKIGKVRLRDLSRFHWSQYGAGYRWRFGGVAPQPFLHAFMLCNRIVEGSVGHTCQHGPPPHKIQVCITRKDNRGSFDFLESLADPRRSLKKVRRKHRKKLRRRLKIEEIPISPKT
jgi:hypothetical protein